MYITCNKLQTIRLPTSSLREPVVRTILLLLELASLKLILILL